MSEVEKKEKREDNSSGEEDYDPEQQVVGDWKLCDLPEVPVVTGEQDEEVIFKAKSKIYRWRAQWKERGVGEMKILKNNKTGYQRILVRADKTHKCIANHYLQSKDVFCKLEPMKTSNNAWTWAAYDISDEKADSEKFCAKFTSKEDFQKFKEQFEKSCEENGKLFAEKKEQDAKEEAKNAKTQITEPKEQKEQKKE